MNKAIGFTVMTRLIQSISGLVTIIFISRFLTNEEQGFYYTFTSFIAIQVFFELGLNTIIVQYTAHEFTHLKWDGILLTGDNFHKQRLGALFNLFVKWYFIICMLFTFTLIVGGWYFFSKNTAHYVIEWKLPWILLVVTTAASLGIESLLGFFEGIGKVNKVAQIRFFQKIAFIILLIISFSTNLRLYSQALASLAALLITSLFIIFSKEKKILFFLFKSPRNNLFSYWNEIFPYQWKIAMSWIAGYFIFYFFNPVIFFYEGPKVAGQMGLTLAAFSGVSSISMSWIITKIPIFSALISKKEYTTLNSLFDKTLKQLLIINIFSITLFLCLVIYLKNSYPEIYVRFLPLRFIILLAIVTFCNQFVFSWASLLRCFKKEPFLINSIIIAILSGSSTFYFGSNYGVNGVIIGYAIITVAIGFPYAYFLYRKYIKIYENL